MLHCSTHFFISELNLPHLAIIILVDSIRLPVDWSYQSPGMCCQLECFGRRLKATTAK